MFAGFDVIKFGRGGNQVGSKSSNVVTVIVLNLIRNFKKKDGRAKTEVRSCSGKVRVGQ